VKVRKVLVRNRALEGAMGRVRLVASPLKKEKIWEVLKTLPHGEVSSRTIEFIWKGKTVRAVDQGEVVFYGEGSQEDFEELQLFVRKNALALFLKELGLEPAEVEGGLKVDLTGANAEVESSSGSS